VGAVEAFLLSARGLFVTVLAAPIVAAACLVLAVEAAEVGNRTWWDGSRPLNAAEAAAFGRAADLVRLLRRGDHPEQVVAVRAAMIRESPSWLSAVEGAMWADSPATIRLLEAEGSVLTNAQRRRLACLARDLGQEATADYLTQGDRTPCAAGASMAAVRARTGPS
jgi:hypothetical protein